MTQERRIYMDHAATTYTDPEVLEAMLPYFNDTFGNPSSVHGFGRDANAGVSEARERIAGAIGAGSRDIYFTSGGTESDNWALIGGARARRDKGRHIISTMIEHHAVLDSCRYLERNGYEVTYLKPDGLGRISPAQVRDAIREDTILVSVMLANNEIGTIEPIAEIGAITREKGVCFHTDAVQAIGHVKVDVGELNVDMLSMSAHKFYGPKGIGALYVRPGLKVDKFMNGGAQERNRRAGTENTPGIVGMGAAIAKAAIELEQEGARLSAMRDALIDRILGEIPEATLNGPREGRLPNNANFCFDGVEGEALLVSLDLMGLAGSSGSACMSGSFEPSYVLTSIGVSEQLAACSLRLTLGKRNTMDDVSECVERIKRVLARLKTISPY